MSTSDGFKTGELFSEDLIQEQLQKIFQCPAFTVSDILRRFLDYIIRETLAGRSNTIKEYTIAVNVLNKPASFRPQHDAIVRIHAGRLRRALNYYYKEAGLGDNIEITVPKGSYVPVFGRLPPVEQKSTPESESIPLPDFSDQVTIAIMPFKTFETDISRLAFTDNLGQQLSAELGRFSDFSIISYYTTRQLPSRKKAIPELTSEFGVQYVVTGNVQFETRKLRVSVQLTESLSGTQIWTEQYHFSYSSSNLFSVSDHVVSRVIAHLGDFNGLIIQQVSKRCTKNKSGNSFETMLSRYYDFYSAFDEVHFKSTYASLKLAVEEHPDNEIAWAFLGQLSLLAFLFNHSLKENPLIQGLKCARRALKINPLSQLAYISLGMAQIFLGNRQASLDSLEYASTLNPNACGSMGAIGCLMISAGDYNRGFTLLEESMEKNKNFPALFHLFISLYQFKQKSFVKAYKEAEISGMADDVLYILLRVTILSQMDRKPEAEALMKTIKEFPFNKTWISKEFIGRLLLDDDLVEQLNKGLISLRNPLLTVA